MSITKQFEDNNNLQNLTYLVKNSDINSQSLMGDIRRPTPILPPRPSSGLSNSYMSYGGYGNYNSFGSYSLPYRSPYSSYGMSYGGYGGYGSYNSYGGYPGLANDDHERRFIQYAEEKSRSTFASVENIVRAFNSLAMMVDSTFFAMTSSFRAVLSVAENFGKLRTMFGHIWYSVNIFRFLNWLYRRLLRLLGIKVSTSITSVAWKQAENGEFPSQITSSASGTNWPTLACLGMLVSAPYIISKFLPKYEDRGDPTNWKSPGVRAKAVFNFIATAPNELTIHTNDLLILAPTYIQEEMNLKNSGWAFAVCKGQSGLVPLNYLVINKNRPILSNQNENKDIPVPRNSNNNINKTHSKRVSFGETQVFENIDFDDYKINKSSDSNLDCQSEEINKKYQESQELLLTNSENT